MAYIVFFIQFFLCNLCFSSSGKSYSQIKREDYAQQLLTLMKKEICYNPEHAFKKCFSISESQCSDSIQKSTKECINFKFKLPEHIDLIDDAPKLNQKIGFCIGEKYYLMNKKKLSSNNTCKTRSAWLR